MNIKEKLYKIEPPPPGLMFFATLLVYAFLFFIDTLNNKASPITFSIYVFVLSILFGIWQYDKRQKLERSLKTQEVYTYLMELLEAKQKREIEQQKAGKDLLCGCIAGCHDGLTPKNLNPNSETSPNSTKNQSNC